MKLVHICPDEKFIDAAYETFETLEPGKNRYLFLGSERKLRHITRTPIEFTGHQPWKNAYLYKELNDASAVILHSLAGDLRKFASSKFATGINFVWVGFGYDYYGFIFDSTSDYYLNKTAELVNLSRGGPIQQLFGSAYHTLRRTVRQQAQRRAISRISYFSPVLESEYSLVKRAFPDMNSFPKQAQFKYGVNAKMFDKLPSTGNTQLGPNILIGNSANPTNNHVEAIDLLADIDLADRAVIVPLSYGYNNSLYIKSVCSYGKERLGSRFKPLTEFLSYQDYADLLESCSFVLMNHKRQQALGNIQMQIARGASVFLRRESPVFDWYQNMGVSVFDIEGISSARSIADLAISTDDRDRNCAVVAKNFNLSAHLKRTRAFINEIVKTN